jgi:hypothetical protein
MPPLHLHAYAEKILVRARNTLLTVIAAPSTHDGRRQIRDLADATRQALLEGPRIQRLALSASPGWVDHVLEAFCGPALELERLDVCARVWNDYDVVDDEDLEHIDAHILAADLLGNAAPKLRRLRLGNCKPPVTSGLYSRLTHLYISFDRLFCHVRGIQATELLLIFNQAHSLISVDIRGIDRDTLEDLVQPDRVTLTDLLFLRLCGEGILETTSRVMDFLEVAPTTQLCIKESSHMDRGDLRELATLLGQQPNVDRVPPLDRLRIRGDPMEGNSIAVKAESGDFVPLRLAVFTFHDDVMDTFGQALAAVVEGLPLQHLRCLEVYSAWTQDWSGDETEEWQAVLIPCPMLEQVIVRAHAVLGFSAAISAAADSATLHPHLKDITLVAARLGKQLDGLSVLAHVQVFAHARQTAGCELRLLRFDNCYYRPGTAGVVGLKSLVRNLRIQLCKQRDVALYEAAPDGYDGDSNYEDEPRHLSDVNEDY